MNAIQPPDRLNQTPYWIMQLPQIFVPDHSSVFQDNLLELIRTVLRGSNLMAPLATPPPLRAKPSGNQAVTMESPASVPTVGRPSMKRTTK